MKSKTGDADGGRDRWHLEGDGAAEDIGPDDKLNNYRLSVYERTRILGTRAKQISTAASPFVKNVSSLTPIEVATEELNNKLVPIKLIRELPNGITETWNLNEFN